MRRAREQAEREVRGGERRRRAGGRRRPPGKRRVASQRLSGLRRVASQRLPGLRLLEGRGDEVDVMKTAVRGPGRGSRRDKSAAGGTVSGSL